MKPDRTPVLVVGAGPTGLSTAYHLGSDALLIERNATVGGGCRSIVEGGFTFDYAGHLLCSDDPYVHELYGLLLGDNVHWQGHEGLDARFGYPIRGGLQALVDGFVPRLAHAPCLQASLVALGVDEHVATLSDGSRVRYDALVSTMPLPELVRLAGRRAPPDVRVAAEDLRHVSLRCVHVGVGREDLTEQHWIDDFEGTLFRRIFVQGNASPACNPPGGFGLTFQVAYDDEHPLSAEGLTLVRRCIEDAQRIGMIRRDDPIRVATQTDLPYAEVVCDRDRAAPVHRIRSWLAGYDVHLAGRYGEWEQDDSDHAFVAGRRVAERVRSMSAIPAEELSGI